jgi:hypothetical protein
LLYGNLVHCLILLSQHEHRHPVKLTEDIVSNYSCKHKLILEYVRSVVREENENIQFIIVTNSSALIDKATAEELYMLMSSQQLAEGSNQLVKVSDATMCPMPS